jgi:hypothetical protein
VLKRAHFHNSTFNLPGNPNRYLWNSCNQQALKCIGIQVHGMGEFRHLCIAVRLVGLFVLCGALLAAEGRQDHAGSAQVAIPAGQSLPVSVATSLQAGKTPAGTSFRAYTTQRVPLPGDAFLPRSAEVLGTVEASVQGGPGQAATLTLRFTGVRFHGVTSPLRVTVVAVASVGEVGDTYDPVSGTPDRFTGPANWTTRQVGGDLLRLSGGVGELDGPAMRKVGYSDLDGVYADPAPGSSLPRALGVFSAAAAGLYGFPESAGLQAEHDVTKLTSPGKLRLRRGDQMLLLVTGQ